MAGCATPTSFAGHPGIEAEANDALIYKMDHLMGSGHKYEVQRGLATD